MSIKQIHGHWSKVCAAEVSTGREKNMTKTGLKSSCQEASKHAGEITQTSPPLVALGDLQCGMWPAEFWNRVLFYLCAFCGQTWSFFFMAFHLNVQIIITLLAKGGSSCKEALRGKQILCHTSNFLSLKSPRGDYDGARWGWSPPPPSPRHMANQCTLFHAKVTLYLRRVDKRATSAAPCLSILMKLTGNQITVHTDRWPIREQPPGLFDGITTVNHWVLSLLSASIYHQYKLNKHMVIWGTLEKDLEYCSICGNYGGEKQHW